jgi:hypothetical protein
MSRSIRSVTGPESSSSLAHTPNSMHKENNFFLNNNNNHSLNSKTSDISNTTKSPSIQQQQNSYSLSATPASKTSGKCTFSKKKFNKQLKI